MGECQPASGSHSYLTLTVYCMCIFIYSSINNTRMLRASLHVDLGSPRWSLFSVPGDVWINIAQLGIKKIIIKVALFTSLEIKFGIR